MKHTDLIKKLTLEEKCAYLSGRDEWSTRSFSGLGISSVFFSDGPSGVRKQQGAGDHLGLNPSVPATCFPSAATLCNSWDNELCKKFGEALGEEAAAENVNVLLGPGVNIKRNPLCGRNFEYFSEDPYLSGKLAAAVIKGVQKNGVGTCVKHFAVNSQEFRRMAMNSVIDERTLREIYLEAFEIAVKEGKPVSLMSSYNEINGIYANENRHLLMDILRNEWGFDGAVITDWGASNDHALGVKNGSTLEMPSPGLGSARELLGAVRAGKITEKDIDDRVSELLLLMTKTSALKKCEDKKEMHERHHVLARNIATECAVLLKNEESILPLRSGTRVAVIGDFAFEPRYQGAGSSLVNSTKVDSVENLIGGYDLEISGMERGYRRDGREDASGIKEAVDIAARADVVLFFFGLNENSESEGLDRIHMRIPQNQIQLLQSLSQVNPNIVGIISAGSAIEMPWHHHFKALLHGYLYGQAGAGAMLDLITGRKNPSGKLNETIPKKYEDTPSYPYYPSRQRTSEYRESLFVGYRYYDTADIPVLYPFGYGLSYTEFEYSDLSIMKDRVSFKVKNVGKTDGAEISQLYVGLENAKVFRPDKELKGFVKTFLKAGEEKEVVIAFDDKTFRYWNVKTCRWETEGGSYNIMIGANVSDIRLEGRLEVKGTTDIYPYEKEKLPSYYSGSITKVPDEEYRLILGRPISDGTWGGELSVNDALCQMYYAKNPLGRFVYNILDKRIKKASAADAPDLNTLFQYNMPFRAIAKMTGGSVSMEMVKGIVDIVNGYNFRGLKTIVKGYFENRHLNKLYKKKYLKREDPLQK